MAKGQQDTANFCGILFLWLRKPPILPAEVPREKVSGSRIEQSKPLAAGLTVRKSFHCIASAYRTTGPVREGKSFRFKNRTKRTVHKKLYGMENHRDKDGCLFMNCGTCDAIGEISASLKRPEEKIRACPRHSSFPGKSSGIELRCTKSPALPARIKAFALRIEQGKFTRRWPLTHKSHNRGSFAIPDQRQGSGSALRSGVPLIGQAGTGRRKRGRQAKEAAGRPL